MIFLMANLLLCLCFIVAEMTYYMVCRPCEKYNSGQNLTVKTKSGLSKHEKLPDCILVISCIIGFNRQMNRVNIRREKGKRNSWNQ